MCRGSFVKWQGNKMKVTKSILTALLLFLAAGFCFSACGSSSEKEKESSDSEFIQEVSDVTGKKICAAYIATWGVYDPVKKKERPWTASDIDGERLTDLILSFAEVNDGNHVSLNTDEVEQYYDQVAALVKKYPHLRVSVAIGGASDGVEDFKALVADSSKMTAFVQNVRALLSSNKNIRGIDIDWEYPGKRLKSGSEAWEQEFSGYISLLSSLRSMMDQLKKTNGISYRLTTALPADNNPIVSHIKRICDVCDGVNLMMYDYSGAWSSRTGHNAPLSVVCNDTLDFIENNADPSKLILGIPFYGQRWTNVEDGGNHGLGSNVGSSSDDCGFEYSKIIPLLSDAGYEKYTDGEDGPYLYSPSKKIFISYTGPQEVSVLTEFALKNSLGGVMTWEYGQDMTGILLKAMSEGIWK